MSLIDESVRQQLQSVFTPLDKNIKLIYRPSFHPQQSELVEFLNDIASTSSFLSVELRSPPDGRQSVQPQFFLEYEGKTTGVSFRGIPGGHELSSLVLAILNANGKGKLPDDLLKKRIKSLKGPIEIKTYVSLSCENCPDVVQALNQMALLHPHFEHEMVDGGFVPEEIESMGIQGVPSIVGANKLIHSGRISLLDLLKLLEETYGITEGDASDTVEMDLGEFEVVVVGGGPAGVSAAIYSVRKGLKTALITERVGGQVQETKGIENLISVPYTEGPILAGQLNQHLNSYPVKVYENRKVKSIKLQETGREIIKIVELESGEFLKTGSLIVATGAKWKELNVPGEKEYLGRGVAFCPHCDGPFYKGKKVAVIGGGNSGVEAAIDLAGIVGEVVVVEYNDSLKADQILINKLKTLSNVSVLTSSQTQTIVGNGQKVVGLEYLDRSLQQNKKIDLDGVFIQIGLVPNSQFLKGVVELTRFGEIVTDAKNRTSVKGIYAAGDVTTIPYKQIIISMGEGAKSALAAFEDRIHTLS